MAKQVIIAALEEVLGEYVLNMSKENLKIAALRGKIKLENVQLDGDLIGSHILSVVGLASFGVLSCSARSVQISIPWNSIEKEPTRVIIEGVHLVCIPLIPSTANKLYGSSTAADPQCTLRTRAKRLVLARFERNYWNGLIQDEGPPMKRILRAVKEVERDLKKKRKNTMMPFGIEEDELDHIIADWNGADTVSMGSSEQNDDSFGMNNLPELPRDWKVKLREKILRNVEASMSNLHIRCEVPEGGLGFVKEGKLYQSDSRSDLSPDKRAFSFGFTLQSLVVRTASENWEAGSHDVKKRTDYRPSPTADEHLGPNDYVVKNNKVGFFSKLSFYWDDQPSILLSETDAIRGNAKKMSLEKLTSLVSKTMDAMFYDQEPGMALRQQLSASSSINSSDTKHKPHRYILESLDAEIRVQSSDRTEPGPISCLADVLPFDYAMSIRPHQYRQYQSLVKAIQLQKRFDTMLHQRPTSAVASQPRIWWRYAISCVMSRPNSRPWEDIRRITKHRERYIGLVVKKNSVRVAGSAFHSGLSEAESKELMKLEDMLPIEAMLAFHLLALRQVYAAKEDNVEVKVKVNTDRTRRNSRKNIVKKLSPFKFMHDNSPRRKKFAAQQRDSDSFSANNASVRSESSTPPRPRTNSVVGPDAGSNVSLLEAMTLRLGKKSWFVDWKLRDATFNVILKSDDHDDRVIAQMTLCTKGNVRSFGIGKRDCFIDIIKFSVMHQANEVFFVRPKDDELFENLEESFEESDNVDWHTQLRVLRIGKSRSEPDMASSSAYLDLPSHNAVCRIVAAHSSGIRKLSISAHPATLFWTTSLFDGLSNFISSNYNDLEQDLGDYIRNATTPLAKKAQLAILSPGSVSIYVNIAAPKVWIPIASNGSEGSLVIDAGTVKACSNKIEGGTDMNWYVELRDIQVNFIKGRSLPMLDNSLLYGYRFGMNDVPGRHDSCIIRPFGITAETTDKVYDGKLSHPHAAFPLKGSIVRSLDVHVSPVCLNLVDGEIIARSFGKWYARGINRVQHRSSVKNKQNKRSTDAHVSRLRDEAQAQARESTLRQVTLNLEKIELAVEGHSKSSASAVSDERSFISLDSFHEFSPPTRVYLVEVFKVSLHRCSQGQRSYSNFVVDDASIVRLPDGSLYTPMNTSKDMIDSQYCILVRSYDDSAPVSDIDQLSTIDEDGTLVKKPIVNARLSHDGFVHSDEVEIDLDSVVLRITPTTLKDCSKAFKRVVELIQVTTKEMERKVHEESRKARQKDHRASRRMDSSYLDFSLDRPISPSVSDAFTEISASVIEKSSSEPPLDSSILFKLTCTESTLLVGRPAAAIHASPMRRGQSTSFAVIQILANVLVMFQSIENVDTSGSKTVHISIDNLSSLVNTEFKRVSLLEASPMIGPTGAEFRVMYRTENLGCVVSQDISLDCEALKSCLTPNDLFIMVNIVVKMIDRMKSFKIGPSGGGGGGVTEEHQGGVVSPKQSNFFKSIIRYRKRGTGIATAFRVEIQEFSFVLLRTYKSFSGAPEFLAFEVKQLKARLEGCLSALSGECHSEVSIQFFNAESSSWENAVESFALAIHVDQMPNELILRFCPEGLVQVNISGIFLRDLTDLNFDIRRDRLSNENVFDPSILSTVGLRRATERKAVQITNLTGLEVELIPNIPEMMVDRFDTGKGPCFLFRPEFDVNMKDLNVCLCFVETIEWGVGRREPIYDLPVGSETSGVHSKVYLLRPAGYIYAAEKHFPELSRAHDGRKSPETELLTNEPQSLAYYTSEPVVDWCMHNQRISSSVSDVFSLPKGADLLSSSAWSPQEPFIIDETQSGTACRISSELQSETERDDCTHSVYTKDASVTGRSNWVRPYLKNDVPEWSDMTFNTKLSRENALLPDHNWIWLNEWSIDLKGKYGETTDSDGWEYHTEFETFTRNRRKYVRGDLCRRRRWTRTRMLLPPRIDDTNRLMKFVWETYKDGHGNYCITIRSHVKIRNNTTDQLALYMSHPNWEGEQFVAFAEPQAWNHVPVALSSCAYLRLVRVFDVEKRPNLHDCASTERFLVYPNCYSGTSYVRTTLELQDVSRTKLHYLVEIESTAGMVDISIEPVMKIINLLPCQLDCRIAERVQQKSKGSSQRMNKVESLQLSSGQEHASTSVSPWMKPQISLRVPGYRWSQFYPIVNRCADWSSWKPSDEEEQRQFHANKDLDYTDEYQATIQFERLSKFGDSLTLILSVECGHCPTIRVFSQFWVLDKTGFGCRFTDNFHDILGSIPDSETSRRSHLLESEAKNAELNNDLSIPGCQWSIGMSGMSLYYSRREKFALSIETGAGSGVGKFLKTSQNVRSKWVTPLDISNVMPKTIFSVDELGGPRRFELAFSVSVCPGIFSRTKLVSLMPRFQVVNLLKRELIIAQDECLRSEMLIPSQAAVPFHWEKGALASKIRIGAPSTNQKDKRRYKKCWSNGCIRLDRVGITALRLPTDNELISTPLVVQAEVRLASKEQASAVVLVIWSANEKSNPLYLLRNRTPHTILCRQPLHDEIPESTTKKQQVSDKQYEGCNSTALSSAGIECGTDMTPLLMSLLGLKTLDEYVWVLKPGDVSCFGFDDPEKPHILEWTYVKDGVVRFTNDSQKAFLEVNAMGSISRLNLRKNYHIVCQIGAEYSTKVIEFSEIYDGAVYDEKDRLSDSRMLSILKKRSSVYLNAPDTDVELKQSELVEDDEDDDEDVAFSVRVDMAGIAISVIDNLDPKVYGREIMLAHFSKISAAFSHTREGYHEYELVLKSFQVDNHVHKSIHPVLIFCPNIDDSEPLLHISAVRRVQLQSQALVFRYAAIRLLEVDIFLDRRTAEAIARFIQPLTTPHDEQDEEVPDWVSRTTERMIKKFSKPDRRAPRDIESIVQSANSGRIYFEQLHLHPVRLEFTFTQEWIEWNPGSETMMIFQFIRGMASIANAPLTFTSFVVGHVFEAPQELSRVVATHYSSQLTKQIFGVLGSLAILGAPADFINNVGTGVKDFFYEPIQGAVHGPRQFIEGLETGTQSLARGVFVGVVRGAANVTEVVNGNLAVFTDDDFNDERKAHQRMLTDAMSRGTSQRTLNDSLVLASESIVRGVKSGALGFVEKPAFYASKHGPVGFIKGVGKAVVGAVVKPVVGFGDAAVLVMNHMSEITSNKRVLMKVPYRLRRALPSQTVEKPNCVELIPYDEKAAKAQKIVTGGETLDDVYIGHIHTSNYLIIATKQCLWAIDRRSREPWCVSWEEISHFNLVSNGLRIVVFSQTGLKSYTFQLDDSDNGQHLHSLLSMQLDKMGNSSDLNSSLFSAEPGSFSRHQIPGIKSRQVNHIFGKYNNTRSRISQTANDERDLVEQSRRRVSSFSSDCPTLFRKLDEESWGLVSSLGVIFSGLSSRRCILAGVINGTGDTIQIKSSAMLEGESACHYISTAEYNVEQNLLHAGGCLLFFGWGVVPNLQQSGSVFLHIDTNAFIADLTDQKSRAAYAEAMPGYQIGFLEKSYDDSGWWAKYWLIVRAK